MEFFALVHLLNRSPIWESIGTELESQIETICDTKGTDLQRMRQQGQGKPDMAILVKRIVDVTSNIARLYGIDEKYLTPRTLNAYRKKVEPDEAEFRFLLERMHIDKEAIDKGINRLSARKKNKGRPINHYKNALTVVLVELFNRVGYTKKKCFSIVSETLNLIGSQEIPESIVEYVGDFLTNLQSSVKAVDHNYYKNRDLYEISHLLDPQSSPRIVLKTTQNT